ncbi:MAG TPA: hypothetical protein VK196_15820 [Magnetospirillum sp.]|nr:hypothetical protein [Magnetospirillum sp.]
MRILFDVIKRWDKDIRRVSEVQDGNVSAVKYIAYQTFWLRKLKPVTSAFRVADIAAAEEKSKLSEESAMRWLANQEVIDINEQLAVAVAVKHLLWYAKSGDFPAPYAAGQFDANTQVGAPVPFDVDALRRYLQYFLKYSATKPTGAQRKTTRDNLVYNLRYRTFGPHHLTHVFEQALMAVQSGQNIVP